MPPMQGTLLGVDPVGENPLVSGKMKGFVFVGIVGFLKYGDVVGTALVEISIFIRIYRINFQADDAEIFPGDLTGISNVFDSGFGTAFSGQNQDFLKAGGGDGCHFFFDFIRG